MGYRSYLFMSVAVIAVVSVMSIFAVLVTAVIAIIIMLAAMLFPILGNIFSLIPAILHKVDLLAAGVVLAAMLAPVFTMTRRYA